MQRRYNLTHFILVGVIAVVLTPLMIAVAAQAQITFMSDRDGHVHPRLGWPTSEIYVMDVDGNNQRRLTNNPNFDISPSWSPDGKRIAFMSDRDGHFNMPGGLPAYEIYVMDADGGNPQNLTNDPNSDSSPSWSPDGKRIVFKSNRDGNRDGNRNNYEIYVMDADGNNQQRLTDNDFYDSSPSWSPDSERIAFVSRRDGHFIGDFGLSYEIYVMDADGKNTRRLTNNRKNDWSPSWSPDGKWIAFSADRKGDDVNFEIYVMDADGNNQRRLTNNRVDDASPSWSSDGKRIVFSSQRDGHVHPILGWPTSEIYVMDTDGKNTRRLTNNPHSDGSPAWFGPAFAVSPTGKQFTTWGWLKQID